MDYNQIIMVLAAAVPALGIVAKILGSLVMLAQSLVPVLPSKTNQDSWEKIKATPVFGPILLALMNFSVIQKK